MSSWLRRQGRYRDMMVRELRAVGNEMLERAEEVYDGRRPPWTHEWWAQEWGRVTRWLSHLRLPLDDMVDPRGEE